MYLSITTSSMSDDVGVVTGIFFFLEPDKGNLSWGIFSFDLTWFSVISVYSSVTANVSV